MSYLDRVIPKVNQSILRPPKRGEQSVMPRGRNPRHLKEAPLLWPVWKQGRPEWLMVDYTTFAIEGFAKNSLIYAAIMYKVRAAMQARFVAATGDPANPEILPIDHPMQQLMLRPNGEMGQRFLQALSTAYYNVAGNSFILLDRSSPGVTPTAMWPLRPDQIVIVPMPDNKVAYWHVPEGVPMHRGTPILSEDMIHIKLPNPLDPLNGLGWGLSPMSALAQVADTDNSVTGFLKQVFDSGLMINVYLKFNDALDDNALDRARDRFTEIYGGWQNWDDVGVTDSGASIEQFGWNFDQLGFGEIDERNESRMAMPFGVPLILIGSRLGLLRSTYSNAKEARLAFWEDTMTGDVGLHNDEWNERLADDDVFITTDLTNVPALKKNLPELVTAFQQLVSSGVSKDAAAKLLGLEVGDLPDGNVSYMPINLIPVGTATEPMTAVSQGSNGEKLLTHKIGEKLKLASKKKVLSNGEIKPSG